MTTIWAPPGYLLANGSGVAPVTLVTPGNQTITSTDTVYENIAGTSGPVLVLERPPVLSKAFGTSGIPLDGSTTLSFTIKHPNRRSALSGVGFTGKMPAGWGVPDEWDDRRVPRRDNNGDARRVQSEPVWSKPRGQRLVLVLSERHRHNRGDQTQPDRSRDLQRKRQRTARRRPWLLPRRPAPRDHTKVTSGEVSAVSWKPFPRAACHRQSKCSLRDSRTRSCPNPTVSFLENDRQSQ